MSGSYTGIFADLKVKLGFGDAGFEFCGVCRG